MNFHDLISNQNLDKLKCTLCGQYLSYFPISVSVNNQRSFCGRCEVPQSTQCIKNISFEAISEFIKFPCRYDSEGCHEQLFPKDVPEHEKSCPFLVIPCPVRTPTSCSWKGSRPTVLHHCQNEHHNMFLKNGEFKIDMSHSNNYHHFVNHDKMLLLIEIQYDSNDKTLQCSIYTCQYELSIKTYTCRLRVANGNKRASIDFKTTSYEEMNPTEFSLESVTSRTELSPFVVGRIEFGDEISTDDQEKTNHEMLSLLKCSSCSELVVPPIYYCFKNSILMCVDCRRQHLSSCNSCVRIRYAMRNVNFDKMANLLDYPCKYQKNGCTYVCKGEKIRQHQECCEHGDLDCPIAEFTPCAWKGTAMDLVDHIQINHQKLKPNSARICKELLRQQMKCDIIKFYNQLFRLVCAREVDDKFLWTVQVIGPFKDDFKFEIELLDTVHGRRLLARQHCSSLSKKDQLFTDPHTFCYFIKNQIAEFMVGDVVTFKVHIFN
jgi:hypothetical protein